jgi:hypothetical protein
MDTTIFNEKANTLFSIYAEFRGFVESIEGNRDLITLLSDYYQSQKIVHIDSRNVQFTDLRLQDKYREQNFVVRLINQWGNYGRSSQLVLPVASYHDISFDDRLLFTSNTGGHLYDERYSLSGIDFKKIDGPKGYEIGSTLDFFGNKKILHDPIEIQKCSIYYNELHVNEGDVDLKSELFLYIKEVRNKGIVMELSMILPEFMSIKAH